MPATDPTSSDTPDVVVIGGGTGGYSTALRAAQLGQRVTIVERAKVGGTCLHWGCIPTKALLHSAEVAEVAAGAGRFGIRVEYGGIDLDGVNDHRRSVVDAMHDGLRHTLAARSIEICHGTARLRAPGTVEVDLDDGGQRTLHASAVVIATGSQPREFPGARFDGERVLSSDHAIARERLPESALVIGSGAVGMEFATAWHAFGVEVTVVEMLDRLLPLEDPDMSRVAERAFRRRGIQTLTDARITDLEAGATGVSCDVTVGDTTERLDAEVALVAIGRRPVTDGLGLGDVGVELDERGYVVVDELCRTNVPGVWAVGDVLATLGLAHASFAEGLVVGNQLGGLDAKPIDYAAVPRVTYSHPEVASVGYTEPEARERGLDVVTQLLPLQSLGRAAIAGESGLVKLVAERPPSDRPDDARIVGIHIAGPRATDLIAEGQLIYAWHALAGEVADLIHAHPSFSEAIGEAHLALAARGLHS